MISNKTRATYLLIALLGFIPALAQAIDAPADPRGSEVGQSLVKWEWNRVPGAVNYQVNVDGGFVGLTKDPQFFSRNLWPGDHSLTVQAVGGDGSYSSRTATVKISVSAQFNSGAANRGFVVGQAPASQNNNSAVQSNSSASASGEFGAPQNPRGSESSSQTVRWEWNPVSGATKYDVTVDGNFAGSSNEASLSTSNLWVGEHSMTVKAINSNGSVSEQSATVKVNVTGNGGDNLANTVASAPPPPQASAPPPPQGDANASNVQSLIDPASNNYPEIYEKPGFELVFSDEFNGTALNPYRWHSQLRWDGEFNGERYEYRVINGEDQFYVNVLSPDQAHLDKIAPVYNPFQFDGSRLAIRAKRNPLKNNNNKRAFGSLSEMSTQQTFLSGAISTHEKFDQKYGYFEARIKIPSHVGTFPAFWLFHENRVSEGTQRTEIDIMENLGHAPWYVYNSFHFFKNVSKGYSGDANFLKPRPSGQIYTGTDYSENYHVYAVNWEPGKVTWFIDGEQVSELYSGEIDYESLYVMLNLAMGGNWANFPTNSGGLGRPGNERYPTQNDINNFQDPALEIDYVRVYRRR